ncbi:MAG: acetoin:2,6-dichlorophenolindophenol oxidoreductase subunit alpha [Solirubrobacterales bacterium]|nr:acetoin:2,6-dichlorophenolindophenol oxidoreductase subunit alpha [Solirubrobacterales bacterium]
MIADDPELLSAAFAEMVLIRRFEEAVESLFLTGQVYGSTHLCIGQEAVSVGVAAALADDDWIACTYRGHGHVLARGSDPDAFMGELLGRSSGTGGGRAGSMNVVDLSRNIIGCFGIVGGSLAAATGVALALKHQRSGVSFAFFGDAAANQAYFSECLNFAKVMGLPVVYVCENNGYGEYTPAELTTPGGILARPLALEIHAETVDGQEVGAVEEAAVRGRALALESGGPVFLEARTYRFSAHGRGDPIEYRPEGEMEAWRKRDPLLLARERLAEYGLDSTAIDAIDAEQSKRVEKIVERCLAAPFPEPDSDRLPEFATSVP